MTTVVILVEPLSCPRGHDADRQMPLGRRQSELPGEAVHGLVAIPCAPAPCLVCPGH